MTSPAIIEVRRARRAGRPGLLQTPADNRYAPESGATLAWKFAQLDRSATFAGIGLIWRDGVRMTPAQSKIVTKSIRGRRVTVRAVSLVVTETQQALRTLPARRVADLRADAAKQRADRVTVTDRRKSLPVAQARRPRTDMERAAARAASLHSIMRTSRELGLAALDMTEK